MRVFLRSEKRRSPHIVGVIRRMRRVSCFESNCLSLDFEKSDYCAKGGAKPEGFH